MGCGIGDIIGVIIGTILGMSLTPRVILGVILGFIFGYLSSTIPMLRARVSLLSATKIILTTEILSIMAMEAAEATTEILFPGMKRVGLIHLTYWLGLGLALISGFVVAFPVNLILVNRGIRHHH